MTLRQNTRTYPERYVPARVRGPLALALAAGVACAAPVGGVLAAVSPATTEPSQAATPPAPVSPPAPATPLAPPTAPARAAPPKAPAPPASPASGADAGGKPDQQPSAKPAAETTPGGSDAPTPPAKRLIGDTPIPAVFADLSFDAAVKKAQADGKLLVINCVSAECEGCMDKLTRLFGEATFADWAAKHAVVILVDEDKDEATLAKLGDDPSHETIVFKDGRRVDNRPDPDDVDDLLDWLDGLRQGKLWADRLVEKAKAFAAGDLALDEEDAASLRDALINRDRPAATLVMLEHLWQVTPQAANHEEDPGRAEQLEEWLSKVLEAFPGARTKLTAWRDELNAKLKDGGGGFTDLEDWLILNDVLGEPEQTLAWYDRVKDREDSQETLEFTAWRTMPLFEARGRWADYLRVAGDVDERLQDMHDRTEHMLNETPEEHDNPVSFANFIRLKFNNQAATLYAANLAMGRDDEAAAIARRVTRWYNTAEIRVSLVEWALKVNKPLPVHREMLDQAQQLADKETGRAQTALTKLEITKLRGQLPAEPPSEPGGKATGSPVKK